MTTEQGLFSDFSLASVLYRKGDLDTTVEGIERDRLMFFFTQGQLFSPE